jgi:hypothetical protein
MFLYALQEKPQQEIQKAYSRAKKDSASGPDGIGLKKLKELDPQFAMTSNLYNVWLYTGKVPMEIKENVSVSTDSVPFCTPPAYSSSYPMGFQST